MDGPDPWLRNFDPRTHCSEKLSFYASIFLASIPPTRARSNCYYPLVHDIAAAARRLAGGPVKPEPEIKFDALLDVPDTIFTSCPS